MNKSAYVLALSIKLKLALLLMTALWIHLYWGIISVCSHQLAMDVENNIQKCHLNLQPLDSKVKM